MAAGLCGICLYYLLENIALTYTQASNVSVIGSTAPFFTALLAHYFMRSAGSLSKQFIIGFFYRDERHRLHQLQRCSHAAQSAG